ncbi:GNAT family N-acetyltransferase [Fredinandcohnia sp. 179-A 10B2 NHS]|uniref:GNAT family N-acetyltransferase n=1 Tax=Fredinandcohnia sp. 179-A 10B2 NHS TaxID=3235176 RepID=UPI0039A34B3A
MIQIYKFDCTDKSFEIISSLYNKIWDQNDSEVIYRFKKHASYDGFKGLVAVNKNGDVIGFTYGYTSMEGQYYRGLLEKHLSEEETEKWLTDCFELVELAVHPDYRKKGIGKSLIADLLENATNSTSVLTTQKSNINAQSLYKSLGWKEISNSFLPDGKTLYIIMGKKLMVGSK